MMSGFYLHGRRNQPIIGRIEVRTIVASLVDIRGQEQIPCDAVGIRVYHVHPVHGLIGIEIVLIGE